MDKWYFEFSNTSYPYLLILGLLLVVIAALYYRRTIPVLPVGLKVFLFIIRSLSILLIILFLCFPTVVAVNERPTGTKLAVLIDRSGSMAFEETNLSRAQQIQRFLDNGGLNLTENNTLIYSFSDSLSELQNLTAPVSDSSLTSLGGAIRDIINSEHSMDIGGILVISDGVSNIGPDPAFEAVRAGIPVSAVALGDTIPIPDIAIEDINASEIVYRGEEIVFNLTLKSDIDIDTKAVLELYRDRKHLKSTAVKLPGGGASQNIPLSVPADSVGEFNYRFVLNGDFDERFTGNNARSVSVQVLKDRLNILLVGEKPGWEFTFMKRALESNDKYHTSTYLPGGKSKNILSPGIAKLIKYDCAMFIGCANSTHNRFGNEIINLIDAGKLNALMILTPASAGSRFERVIRKIGLLPERRRSYASGGQFLPQVINSSIPDPLLRLPGGNFREKFSNMPPVHYRLVGLNPGDDWEIVMNSGAVDERPLPLIMHTAFNGNRIVAINGGPLWRWDFYMNRSEKPDSSYRMMIENIVTWITISGQTEPIEVFTDRRLYDSGSKVNFKGRILDDNYRPVDESAVIVTLEKKGVGEIGFELHGDADGKFTGSPGRLLSGIYSYKACIIVSGDTIKTLEGKFTVQQFSDEFRSLTANRKLLAEIAATTGGLYYNIEETITESFPLKTSSITERKPYSISSLPAAMIIVLILLTVEWAVRKRRQLP